MQAALKILAFASLLCGCVTLDNSDRESLQQHHIARPIYEKMLKGEVLDLGEIAALSKKKVPPSLIIRYLDKSLAEYHLNTTDVLFLRREGVSTEVVDYLLTTPSLNAAMYYDPYWPTLPSPFIIHRPYRRR